MAENKKSLGHQEHSKLAEERGILSNVSRPLKIVFLGAGSAFFKALFVDVMNIADEGEMALVDIDESRLDISEKLGNKIIHCQA